MNLIVILTYLCNFDCQMCLREGIKTRYFPLGLLQTTLVKFKKAGYKTVFLTGGEPFLHPQFQEVVECIIERKFDFGLVTNGWYVETNINILRKYKKSIFKIEISLDAADPKLHDSIRKVGSFEKIMAAISLVRKEGISVGINTCLTKNNTDQIEKIVDLSLKLNIGSIKFINAVETKLNKSMLLSEQQRENCLRRILKLRATHKNLEIGMSPSFVNRNTDNFCEILQNFSTATVNPMGDLLFCCDLPGKGYSIGNVMKENVSDLIGSYKQTVKQIRGLYRSVIRSSKKSVNPCRFCSQILV